jgi:hypothetical protein
MEMEILANGQTLMFCQKIIKRLYFSTDLIKSADNLLSQFKLKSIIVFESSWYLPCYVTQYGIFSKKFLTGLTLTKEVLLLMRLLLLFAFPS